MAKKKRAIKSQTHKGKRTTFEEKTTIKQASIKVKKTEIPKVKVPQVKHPRIPLTQAEIDYRKQERRIKNFIRGAEKRGFHFEYELPKEPRKVTQRDVNRLRGVKPDYLYTKAVYINKETGEVISGTQRRTQERREAAAKGLRTRREKANRGLAPSRTEQILSWMESRISDYEENYSANKRWTKGGVDITHYGFELRELYHAMINDYGRDEIARRFEAHPEVKEYADVVFADSKEEAIQLAFNRFIEVMTGGAMTLEEDSDYNDTDNY